MEACPAHIIHHIHVLAVLFDACFYAQGSQVTGHTFSQVCTALLRVGRMGCSLQCREDTQRSTSIAPRLAQSSQRYSKTAEHGYGVQSQPPDLARLLSFDHFDRPSPTLTSALRVATVNSLLGTFSGFSFLLDQHTPLNELLLLSPSRPIHLRSTFAFTFASSYRDIRGGVGRMLPASADITRKNVTFIMSIVSVSKGIPCCDPV